MTQRHVHFVDDEEPVRRALGLLLKVNGYSAAGFESGAAFLEVADVLVPGVLLVDVRMPGINGLEVQKRLLDRGRDLPVVVMTGHGDLTLAISALQAGAVAFLEKPFAKTTLVEALEVGFLKLEEPKIFEDALNSAALAVGALSAEDQSLLASLAAGRTAEGIATEVGQSAAAIEIRRTRLFASLGVQNLNGAMRMAFAATQGDAQRVRDST